MSHQISTSENKHPAKIPEDRSNEQPEQDQGFYLFKKLDQGPESELRYCVSFKLNFVCVMKK